VYASFDKPKAGGGTGGYPAASGGAGGLPLGGGGGAVMPSFPVLDELGISVLPWVVAPPVGPLSRVGAPTRATSHSFVDSKFRTSRGRRSDVRSPTVLHAREVAFLPGEFRFDEATVPSARPRALKNCRQKVSDRPALAAPKHESGPTRAAATERSTP
jgi:hypothetical protein